MDSAGANGKRAPASSMTVLNWPASLSFRQWRITCSSARGISGAAFGRAGMVRRIRSRAGVGARRAVPATTNPTPPSPICSLTQYLPSTTSPLTSREYRHSVVLGRLRTISVLTFSVLDKIEAVSVAAQKAKCEHVRLERPPSTSHLSVTDPSSSGAWRDSVTLHAESLCTPSRRISAARGLAASARPPRLAEKESSRGRRTCHTHRRRTGPAPDTCASPTSPG